MNDENSFGLQALVFFLVGSAFTSIYLTQPVLPVLQAEFSVSEGMASLSISSVIFGIALSNLPLGALADRLPVRPIILSGGVMVSLFGMLSALAPGMNYLVAARFVQGLFIPSMTTCMAAYLARSLPRRNLNVVMGSYVSATVAGGLGGRLLGGWIHPPLNWRYAFLSASALVLVASVAAFRYLPKEARPARPSASAESYVDLLARGEILCIYLVAFGAFFVFSSVFNYLPFYLAGPAFNAPTGLITFMYLAYIIGIIVGPLAGKFANRFGSGATMTLGAVVFLASVGLTLIGSIFVIVMGLAGICAGFFAIHASAAGSLNVRVRESRGRANSLYVLFYYLGGFAGISFSGVAYGAGGWPAVVGLGAAVLMLPFGAGLWEMRRDVRRLSDGKTSRRFWGR